MNVLFLDTVHPSLQDELEKMGFACEDGSLLSLDEVEARVANYEGIVIRSRIALDKDLLSKATRLRFIARSGSGMENIDVAFAESRNIRCFNAPEGNCDAVGEHALGMLLALLRKLPAGDRNVRSGNWSREAMRGAELGGKTVGVIGYGNTGSAFAQKLAGLGVQVLAFDKYKTNFGSAEVKESSLETICRQADVISFHVPLTGETTHYFSAAFLQKCAKPIVLINTSRGAVVSTAALVAALQSGRVAGACLDVLEEESASFEEVRQSPELNYLFQAGNVILSPHVAGWTTESYRKLAEVLAAKIKAALGPQA